MWIGCLVIVLAGFARPARANFVVSIGSTTVPQGGTGSLDVLVSSTASAASPDQLNNLAFTLQITGPNELRFSPTQSFSYLNSAQYIFSGDSGDHTSGLPGGTVANTVYTGDTFIGSDSAASGKPVSLSAASGPVLLAHLSLDATITNVGDSYTIGLVPPSGNGSINSSSFTVFDVFNSSTGAETSAVPFTSNPGTVTITAAAVPEPASIVSGLTGLALLAGFLGAYRLRHPRKQAG
jgi:hypothetical protein